MTIEHIPGSQNLIADVLSRNTNGIDMLQLKVKEFLVNALRETVEPEITDSLRKIKELQQADSKVKKIIDRIAADDTNNVYCLSDGLLLRKNNGFNRVIIPSSRRLHV